MVTVQYNETPDAVTGVRLPTDLRERLDELARIVGRAREDLIVDRYDLPVVAPNDERG